MVGKLWLYPLAKRHGTPFFFFLFQVRLLPLCDSWREVQWVKGSPVGACRRLNGWAIGFVERNKMHRGDASVHGYFGSRKARDVPYGGHTDDPE
jgi:hypothetical protein